MGPGVDPHLYKPTAGDISAITSCDLLIYHGLKLEGKLGATLEKAKENQVTTYSVCSVIADGKLLEFGSEDDLYPDPHLWFSPDLWVECMLGVAQRLGTAFPSQKDQIIAKAKDIKSQWLEIAEWARTELNSIPKHKRILVTSHDAFRYFGEFYDIEVIALQGISTSQEAGLADRTNLVDFIREKGIGCVFVESSVNPKAIKEIANETGISIGAPLYSDALGDGSQIVIGPREKSLSCNSWAGMTIYNVQSILEGLRN